MKGKERRKEGPEFDRKTKQISYGKTKELNSQKEGGSKPKFIS